LRVAAGEERDAVEHEHRPSGTRQI
jgi:hypothetical protein